jgi:hypothetical protein
MKLFLEPHPIDDNYFMNGFSFEDLEQTQYKHLYSRHMFTANYFPFNIVYNIPDEPYLYPIRSDMLITYPGNTALNNLLENFSFTIPDSVIADVKRNKCKILIDNCIEAYDVIITEHDSTINQILLKTIKKYNLSKQDIILITGNYKSATSEHYTVAIKNWTDTLITPCDDNFFEKQKHMILSKKARPKKILTFMRKERLFRFHLANFIYNNNLREPNIVTFGKNVSQYYWGTNSTQFPEEFVNSLPWEYDVDTSPANTGLDHLLARSDKEITAFTETYINCVAERSMRYLNYELDISEKIFKPIAFLQPFFVFGQPGTLDYMKSIGYRTFDRWWDESYDVVTSGSIRFKMLTRLYKKLSLASDTELADIMYEAWPILEHNYYTYVDYVRSGKTNQDLLKTIQLSFDK